MTTRREQEYWDAVGEKLEREQDGEGVSQTQEERRAWFIDAYERLSKPMSPAPTS